MKQQRDVEIYKKEKINPVRAVSHPDPVPVFYSLYKVLLSQSKCGTRVLRMDQGLSAPDPTTSSTVRMLPFDPTHVGVRTISCSRLAIIMGFTMCSDEVNTTPPIRPEVIFDWMPLICSFCCVVPGRS